MIVTNYLVIVCIYAISDSSIWDLFATDDESDKQCYLASVLKMVNICECARSVAEEISMLRIFIKAAQLSILALAIFVPPSFAQAQLSCEQGTPSSRVIVDVKGNDHELRSGPSDKSPRIVNEKATAVFGKTHYQSIDSSVQVQMLCENGDWVKIKVTKPEWLATYGWVKREILATPRAGSEARTFTEKDIYWDKRTKPYKEMIIKAVNRIHREDPRCKEDIDAGTVSQSTNRGTPSNPVFFVTCGTGTNVVNVYFSAEDVAAAKTFRAPAHIDRGRAIGLCENHAKRSATHPSTVSFSRIMDLSISEHPNGRTSVQSSFTAKNSFNLTLKYNIRCLLDQNGFIEANINEATH